MAKFLRLPNCQLETEGGGDMGMEGGWGYRESGDMIIGTYGWRNILNKILEDINRIWL